MYDPRASMEQQIQFILKGNTTQVAELTVLSDIEPPIRINITP